MWLLEAEIKGGSFGFPSIHTCMHAYVGTHIHTYVRAHIQTGRQAGRQAGRQSDSGRQTDSVCKVSGFGLGLYSTARTDLIALLVEPVHFVEPTAQQRS